MSESTGRTARANVLIVEDSSVFREMQGLLLRQAGYAVSAHEHPSAALEAARARPYDLVVVDYELPGMNGEEFMHQLRKFRPEIAVVFVSGSLTIELAIKLSQQSVAGIFHKPVNPKVLLEKINETISRAAGGKGSNSPLPAARRGSVNAPIGTQAPFLVSEPAEHDLGYVPRHFHGASKAFRELTHRVWRVRDFRAVLLLQGEPGSPFEPIARDLAEISVFREGPVMTCDAAEFETRRLIEVLAPTLLSPDAGTLIVTGIETFDAARQKILENLTTARDVFLPFARRFRLILGAPSNFSELADDGRFNETLYYKISSLMLNVPPLRELAEDIPRNAEHLLAEHRLTLDFPFPFALTPAAADWVTAQTWPGNYDQLSQTLLEAAKSGSGAIIDVPALSAALAPLRPKPAGQPLPTPVTAKPFPVSAPAASVAASVFRPASVHYDFGERLAASLANARVSKP